MVLKLFGSQRPKMLNDIIEFNGKKFREIGRNTYKRFLFKLINTDFIHYEGKSNGVDRFFVEIGVGLKEASQT